MHRTNTCVPSRKDATLVFLTDARGQLDSGLFFSHFYGRADGEDGLYMGHRFFFRLDNMDVPFNK